MTQEPGERIGEGGSAEVFAYGEGAVLKLFRPEYGFAADTEAQRTQAVHVAGIPAPRVLDVVVVGGRRGLVLERIEGRTLLEELVAGRCAPRTAGAMTAELQTVVHRVAAELPRLADVAGLRGLPDGCAVAHLDLHPGNVMRSPHGLVAIDWVNAHLAAVAADVARSVMTIRYQGLGRLGAAGGVDEERDVRSRVLDGYLDRFHELGGRPEGLDLWLGRTAARLLAAEPSNPDRDQLEHLVEAIS